jgi:hypothetical protein
VTYDIVRAEPLQKQLGEFEITPKRTATAGATSARGTQAANCRLAAWAAGSSNGSESPRRMIAPAP